MTTAMARALVEKLDVGGVEQVWSKLNKKNAIGQRQEKPVENKLFYVAPDYFVRKRGKKNENQLLIPGFSG